MAGPAYAEREPPRNVKHGLTLGASAQHEGPKDVKVEVDDVVIELLKE